MSTGLFHRWSECCDQISKGADKIKAQRRIRVLNFLPTSQTIRGSLPRSSSLKFFWHTLKFFGHTDSLRQNQINHLFSNLQSVPVWSPVSCSYPSQATRQMAIYKPAVKSVRLPTFISILSISTNVRELLPRPHQIPPQHTHPFLLYFMNVLSHGRSLFLVSLPPVKI